ncbi:hypothetical protein BOS5A_230537 [Bosea sp. EC-HK365B]|nr:hypothetical protein BOSE7B_60051 [Bosea sp. 7B]VVT61260.1 hypothetical protein BOS5A_230537 [Bosea sp. EC-HK365B]VXB22600.1 hypothetical protein BOSE127_110051 [Bosea sp. 127]
MKALPSVTKRTDMANSGFDAYLAGIKEV